MPRIICVDFDGVIHSYKSGWKGIDVLPDPPVPGAMEWLVKMCGDPDYEIHVYSSRSSEPAGLKAMQEWLDIHLRESARPRIVNETVMKHIKWPTQKPPAWLTIDDRCICFRGTFPTKQEMVFFKPWNKA